jgi:hypothetical protein
MKSLLMLAGLLLLALGLVFMAQGSGYLPWPRESFMVGAGEWVYYGGGIAVLGFLIIFASWFSP